jgi:hypothetical protein
VVVRLRAIMYSCTPSILVSMPSLQVMPVLVLAVIVHNVTLGQAVTSYDPLAVLVHAAMAHNSTPSLVVKPLHVVVLVINGTISYNSTPSLLVKPLHVVVLVIHGAISYNSTPSLLVKLLHVLLNVAIVSALSCPDKLRLFCAWHSCTTGPRGITAIVLNCTTIYLVKLIPLMTAI